jgi:hypothetical protein
VDRPRIILGVAVKRNFPATSDEKGTPTSFFHFSYNACANRPRARVFLLTNVRSVISLLNLWEGRAGVWNFLS